MATISQNLDMFRQWAKLEDASLCENFAELVTMWKFSTEDHERHEVLSQKSRDGTLTVDERDLLNTYVQADAVISLLKRRVERVLRANEAPECISRKATHDENCETDAWNDARNHVAADGNQRFRVVVAQPFCSRSYSTLRSCKI
jgi:hypothetical protein